MVLYPLPFVLCLFFPACFGVIYQINASDYQRMPPLFHLDEYEACLSEQGGMYCLVQLNLYAEPDNELMHMIQEYSNHMVKHYNHSNIDRGVCVPKTCKKFTNGVNATKDLRYSLEACLNNSIWREYGLNAKISKLLYCNHHSEQDEINLLDWIVLAAMICVVVLNTIGSLSDYFAIKESKVTESFDNAFLLNFSLLRNWKSLTNTQSDDPKVRDLKSFHGIRVTTCIGIVLAHTLLLIAAGFTTNPHDFEKSYERPFYYLIYGGMMVVQIFFFISGYLTAHYLQFEEKKRVFTAWDIPKIIFTRICRLLPALAMTLAITLTWVRHLGSGPLWRLFVTDSLVADCQTYWWHTLLFVNNYMPNNKYCLLQTWHLAADMQVFAVGLCAYTLSAGRRRRCVLGALLLLGAVAPAVHTLLQDLDPIVIMMPEFFRTLESPTYRFQHILGHNNLPAFIIGMATADFVYELKKTRGDLTTNKLYSYGPTLVVAAIPLVFYSGRMFYQDSERASLWFRAVYSAAIRVVLGALCALAMPGLVTRSGSLMKAVFEWRMWVVPSRLSYCVYLLHMILVHILLGSRPDLNSVSFIYVLFMHLGIVVMSYVIALPLYLMVEAPCNRIFKVLMTRYTVSDQTPNGHQKRQ